jgi:5-methylcytosine-specific restriction endonuclease McrA
MSNSYFFVSPEQVQKEKQKARLLKKKQWWLTKKNTGICHYCGQKFPPQELTMDHVVPISRGGTTTPGNVVPCCKECNYKKGVDTPVDLLLMKNKSDLK